MKMNQHAGRAMKRLVGAVAIAAGLAACGGSDPQIDNANTGCSVAQQKDWLRGYMRDWYFWSGSSPDPAPGPYASVADYFTALLLPGEGRSNPALRFSYISDTAAYNQLFGEGVTLGYGLFVNGVELKALFDAGQPLTPLKLRFVEAASPAAGQLARGDTIISINGTSAAAFIAADDYSALTPTHNGETLNLVVDRGAGPVPVVLTAATYSLTPVTAVRTLTLPNGNKAGYLVLKDFITQAEAPLAAAFTDFASAGATELIIDLRYNGGGRVSTSAWLASLVAGVSRSGRDFVKLRLNTQQAPRYDTTYPFAGATAETGAGYSRVVVLTGSRTCSASELIVNGLKPYATVVTIGGTTCGKPVGFLPQANCASTYSAVNFESLNANDQGRYYDGIAATCAAADDFNGELGLATEKLTAAAVGYLQTGSCPVAAGPVGQARALSATRAVRPRSTEPGERQGMWAD